MENKNQETKLNITIKSVYTLDRNKIGGIGDFKDKNTYLYKDGIIAMCPYMSGIGMDWHTKQHALLPYPCGSFCQHFHIAPEVKKVLESVEGKEQKVEKIIKTGMLKVGLSCGSSNVSFQIANIKMEESKPLSPAPPNPSETHLKVENK